VFEDEDLDKDDTSGSSGTSSAQAQGLQSANDGQSPGQPKRRKLQSSMSSFLDTSSKDEVKKIDQALAKAVYAGGLPFSVFENNPFFSDAFKLMRPSYPRPPSALRLSTSLLNAEFATASCSTDEKIKKALCLSIIADGLTNCRSEGIINYLVGTPEIVFYGVDEPGDEKEDSEYISRKMCEKIRDLGSTRVLLAITDNAPVMQAAWERIKVEFPHIFFLGCVAHGLNLLVKDIMKTVPLARLNKLVVECIKSFKRQRVNAAVFRSKQEKIDGSKPSKSLRLPANTRFAAAAISFESLERNKTALQEAVLHEKVEVTSEVRANILDNQGLL